MLVVSVASSTVTAKSGCTKVTDRFLRQPFMAAKVDVGRYSTKRELSSIEREVSTTSSRRKKKKKKKLNKEDYSSETNGSFVVEVSRKV